MEMKTNGSTSPKIPSSLQSRTSSRLRINATGRGRKVGGKNALSALLQQRQALRVMEGDVDMTPKPLIHPTFGGLDDGQMTAFELIGLSNIGSNPQLVLTSSVGSNSLKASSPTIARSYSVLMEVTTAESLLSTQVVYALPEDVDVAPSQFYLHSVNSGVFPSRPDKVTIILKETETFFIFEMPQLTGDLTTEEGLAIQADNKRYLNITHGGVLRKLVEAESQTIIPLRKSRGTYLGRCTRKNSGIYVNNWVMHDTYARPDLMREMNGLLMVHTEESIQRMLAQQDVQLQYKLPMESINMNQQSIEEQLEYISKHTNFQDIALVMQRIVANNVYIDVQKRFKGLIKEDPCSLDLEFTYSLNLLWIHSWDECKGRPVSSFRWNISNTSVLAVSYGASASSDVKNGLLLLWSAKNPSLPGRIYDFSDPVSDIDWSRDKPNLLAIGFYDGSMKVIDVSNKALNVTRKSRRATSLATEPHWQVQWWPGDEQYNYQEQIYTSCQDGRVFCYRSGEDFTSVEIMRIGKIEGKIAGVKRTDHCIASDIPINRNPGALILKRHPTLPFIYFIGSDEGCIYRCSTNYLHQYIENFLAHDGPVYSMEFSKFCPEVFLTCGADWCTRIWADGLPEPLITLSTTMACVKCAAWCPTNSTIIASIVNNEICIWDIKRKIYTPTSVTSSPNSDRLIKLEFTADGNQLVVADVEGVVYVYNLEGMPFPPYNQKKILVDSIRKALTTKPALLKKLKKTGPPFSEEET